MYIDRSPQGAGEMVSRPIFKQKQSVAHIEWAQLAMKYIANSWQYSSKQLFESHLFFLVRVSQLCL